VATLALKPLAHPIATRKTTAAVKIPNLVDLTLPVDPSASMT